MHSLIGPPVRFMVDELKKIKKEVTKDDFLCLPCDETRSGGFSPTAIILCYNRLPEKKMQEHTMVHEMVHMYDNTKFKVDWTNLKHQACSEVSITLSVNYNVSLFMRLHRLEQLVWVETVNGQERLEEDSLDLQSNIRNVWKEELFSQCNRILTVVVKKKLSEQFWVYLTVVLLTLDLLMKFIKLRASFSFFPPFLLPTAESHLKLGSSANRNHDSFQSSKWCFLHFFFCIYLLLFFSLFFILFLYKACLQQVPIARKQFKSSSRR